MAVTSLVDWLDENSGSNIVWYVKRLSANDTLANNTHQAGPYLPKGFLFTVLPNLYRPDIQNPYIWFDLYIDSHADARTVKAIWYNNKVQSTGTRNEARVTNFGGIQSPLLDPESTGALTIFAFYISLSDKLPKCHVWVCRNELEEDVIEQRLGVVEPGAGIVRTADINRLSLNVPHIRGNCRLNTAEIPTDWFSNFPTGAEVVKKVLELRPENELSVDQRLLRRSRCENELFQSLEASVELPRIQRGFDTIEEFILFANSILQRRKSRAGKSLELHTYQIFLEEGLEQGKDFDYQAQTENNKRPDFIFPSIQAYGDSNFPVERLRMLAVKRTLRDRWRQVINEANRIQIKHLLTLQEGVSENQFQEMIDANIQLVVPESLIDHYPVSIRPRLQSFESFIGDIRLLTIP